MKDCCRASQPIFFGKSCSGEWFRAFSTVFWPISDRSQEGGGLRLLADFRDYQRTTQTMRGQIASADGTKGEKNPKETTFDWTDNALLCSKGMLTQSEGCHETDFQAVRMHTSISLPGYPVPRVQCCTRRRNMKPGSLYLSLPRYNCTGYPVSVNFSTTMYYNFILEKFYNFIIKNYYY